MVQNCLKKLLVKEKNSSLLPFPKNLQKFKPIVENRAIVNIAQFGAIWGINESFYRNMVQVKFEDNFVAILFRMKSFLVSLLVFEENANIPMSC